MEALDGSTRLNSISSLLHREQVNRIDTSHQYSSQPTMAATAVVSPTGMYSHPPPPYSSSGWSDPGRHSVSGLISPPDSRRTSEKTDPPPIQTSQPQPQPHRQSLPSIHEALSNPPKSSNAYASPISASIPSSQQIPYPSQAPPLPRTYPPADHAPYPSSQLAPSQPRQPSPPHPVHSHPSPFTRSEPGPPGLPEMPRHQSLNTLQGPPAPHNPYAGQRYDPTSRFEPDPRSQERAPNGYSQHPPQQPTYTFGPGPQGPPPPPGHTAPIFNQPRYPPRDPREVPETWKKEEPEPPFIFRHGLKRNFDVWDFEETLAMINKSSSALSEWSAHYNAIASEQQRNVNVIPDRMPTSDSIDDMLQHQLRISNALVKMQSIIREHQQYSEQRMREQPPGPGSYDDEMSMYGDDMKNHGYGSEGKKRRGRAAPPGRCHSCSRSETPEWRRGPDGARTLCNACGLHYAKLTRKNTMKQSQGSNGSSLRPKSLEDVSPRPL